MIQRSLRDNFLCATGEMVDPSIPSKSAATPPKCRPLPSNVRISDWRTRVPGVPHGGTTWMGPGMAHDMLKDVRQGGVDFKLFRST